MGRASGASSRASTGVGPEFTGTLSPWPHRQPRPFQQQEPRPFIDSTSFPTEGGADRRTAHPPFLKDKPGWLWGVRCSQAWGSAVSAHPLEPPGQGAGPSSASVNSLRATHPASPAKESAAPGDTVPREPGLQPASRAPRHRIPHSAGSSGHQRSCHRTEDRSKRPTWQPLPAEQ